MADPTDPLSTATRSIKRNLLIASILAIAANAFKVTVDKIPLAGLSINFDERLFGFLLFTVLIYFLCTFIIYYSIDIKNFKGTEHEIETEKTYEMMISNFPADYRKQIEAALRTLAPKEYELHLPEDYGGALAASADVAALRAAYTYTLVRRGPPSSEPIFMERNAETEQIFALLDWKMKQLVSRYPDARKANRFRAGFLRMIILILYRTRNYIIDGALPIFLGVLALGATFHLFDLHWLQDVFPTKSSP